MEVKRHRNSCPEFFVQLVIERLQVHESQNSESENLRPERHPPTRRKILLEKQTQTILVKKQNTKQNMSRWSFLNLFQSFYQALGSRRDLGGAVCLLVHLTDICCCRFHLPAHV